MSRDCDEQEADLDVLRARLVNARGPAFWRSLDELADTPAFRRYLHEEFPGLTELWQHTLDRRGFLKMMAASLALAGLSGCGREPTEKIVPYVKAQPGMPAGKAVFYATAALRDGYAIGTRVEKYMGRPIKVEGNPDHPASLGATDIFAQASVLELWDPDRAQTLRYKGRIDSWNGFQEQLLSRRQGWQKTGGAGLRVLTGTVTSPSVYGEIQRLLETFPNAGWHQYQPVNRDNTLQGTRLAFGEFLMPRYHLDRPDVIVSLDGDFLSLPAGRLRYARDFTRRRDLAAAQTGTEPTTDRNRLYAVESAPTLVGALADNRWQVRPGDVTGVARNLADRFGVRTAGATSPLPERVLSEIALDLHAHHGRSLVVVGERQPPEVHALAHLLNELLGNVGQTVDYIPPADGRAEIQARSLRTLADEMVANEVDSLLIIGGNPVYTAPTDTDFSALLKKVPFSAYLSLYQDETADRVLWHIPKAHYYEAWGDARAYDGTATIMQPMIAPLYGGRSELELLATLNGEPSSSAYDVVTRHWKSVMGSDFDRRWRESLRAGLLSDTAASAKPVQVDRGFLARLAESPKDTKGLELNFIPDSTIWDGEYANLGWLQELPKPLTKLTWDNVAMFSLRTAAQLRLKNQDVVELRYRGRKVEAPVWITPGHPDGAVTVSLGYGRTRAGRVGEARGFNAYALRTLDAPWFGQGLEVRKTGATYALASAQHHHTMEGRPIVRTASLRQYKANPDFAREEPYNTYPEPSLYPEFKYDGYKWGMTVNLNTCIGCASCVVACQAENNIPVVGKDQVMLGREMQWLRIDRYYAGPPETPRTHFQPVPCMQCEKAPCEVVCPVEASIHDSEGINVQVYNRCVGTRFCSNNCPYKVRRFNFLQYSKDIPALNAQKNPEVTVRMRGVMEKCNYCLHRLSNARIEAKNRGRRIRDGEVLTACQAACPTGAIVFGDLNDAESQVLKLKRTTLNYSLLAELNTVPRTTYLAQVTNPNPALDEDA